MLGVWRPALERADVRQCLARGGAAPPSLLFHAGAAPGVLASVRAQAETRPCPAGAGRGRTGAYAPQRNARGNRPSQCAFFTGSPARGGRASARVRLAGLVRFAGGGLVASVSREGTVAAV